MTTFHIFTIFPNIFSSYFNESILKRSQEKKIIKIKIYNIRDFAGDKHKTADDSPYGGGPGMVLKIEPIIKTVLPVLNDINVLNEKKKKTNRTKIILLSTREKQFNQKMARNWAKKYKDIVLICGHYEGIDARLKKALQDLGFTIQEVSIGSYILSGGEVAAMVVIDAISRHIPGVLGKIESLEEKKGSYPVYTRPEIFEFRGKKYPVPKILMTGNHKKISEWRMKYGKII